MVAYLKSISIYHIQFKRTIFMYTSHTKICKFIQILKNKLIICEFRGWGRVYLYPSPFTGNV